MRGKLILVGYRGSGKSTIAASLAKKLNTIAVDADQLIADEAGRTIPEIFAAEGEAGFRQREHAVIDRVLSGSDDMVLATGGGCVVTAAVRSLLQASQHPVCYLSVPVEELQRRLSADLGDRPSLSGQSVVAEVPQILAQREGWYQAVADHVIDAARSVELICDDLQRIVENSTSDG